VTPPRLLAVAPPDWQRRLGQFRAELQRFADEVQPLGAQAAVYLRAHGHALASWQAWLTALDIGALQPLRIGMTVPSNEDDSRLVAETMALAHRTGVAFVHLPAHRPPDAWALAAATTPYRVGLSCAWHADGPTARERLDSRCEWLVVSPALTTPSKPGVPALGLPELRRLAALAPRRLVALGGIDAANAPDVLATGVGGVACLRAAWSEAAALCAACR